MIHNSDSRAVDAARAILTDATSEWATLADTTADYRSPVFVAVLTDESVAAAFATVRPTDTIGEVAIAIADSDALNARVTNPQIYVLPVASGAPRDLVAALVATSARDAATRRNTTKRVATPLVTIGATSVALPTHSKCGSVQSVLATGYVTCQPCASASAKKSTSNAAPTVAATDDFDPLAEFLTDAESAE